MANDKKTIIRTKKADNYVVLDKFGINDDRLSWKAKGLLVYLLSKPDDWHVYEADLVKRSTDGRDAVRAGLRELEKYGYMIREQLRGENGSFSRNEYIVYERPVTVDGKSVIGSCSPQTDFPSTGKTSPDNPPLLSNDLLLNNDLTLIDCENDDSDPIYQSLKESAEIMFVEDTVSLKTQPHILAEIYIMLLKQFANMLDPAVVKHACQLFSDRSYDWRFFKMKKAFQPFENPVGFFNTCYKDAVKAYKASKGRV